MEHPQKQIFLQKPDYTGCMILWAGLYVTLVSLSRNGMCAYECREVCMCEFLYRCLTQDPATHHHITVCNSWKQTCKPMHTTFSTAEITGSQWKTRTIHPQMVMPNSKQLRFLDHTHTKINATWLKELRGKIIKLLEIFKIQLFQHKNKGV